ncbi:MAG: phenylpropionate dioxygenase-like ring-hydroxylating dioxygenase large terminal subunit [Halieaceae bacterium]|jgi:phenylpropionate dioxygenase-like ring-hydroxylating dioxygenase large terminal subunit
MTVKNQHFEPVPKEDLAFVGTDPIPTEPYYQPEYFELEREAIFKRSWIQIGHSCEISDPGSFIVRPFEAGNTSLLITRDRDGEVRAFHNVCPHRGTELVQVDSGKRSRFTCPYHAWTFSNEGKLLSAPEADKFYTNPSNCSLPAVSVGVCAGFIFINLDKSPQQTLKEYLGPLVPELEKLPHAKATNYSEYIYEVDANWKLTYDNFQENYHLRFIHPRSGEAAGGPQNPYGYPVRYRFYDPHRSQTIWSNPDAELRPFQAFAFGKGARHAMQAGYNLQDKEYFGIFPNLFILGAAMTPFSQLIVPIAANKTRSIIRLYWNGEDDTASERFAREYAMATALDIHCEDRAVIEAGHRGLASGALSHLHFQSQEVLCRHLFNQVDQRVQAYKAELKNGTAEQ